MNEEPQRKGQEVVSGERSWGAGMHPWITCLRVRALSLSLFLKEFLHGKVPPSYSRAVRVTFMAGLSSKPMCS